MITRVRLRNWRSHLDTDLSFSSGVNALVGIMGSGKSSVMDAICFSLFGTFPALQGRKLSLDDLLMDRPQLKESGGVEVEFQADGRQYTVRREIARGKGTSAEIRQDGVLREVNSREVTREVERILGMDYELFSRAVYSEQNGIDYFLRIPAGRRREHIDRLLRLDRFELARSEAVALRNRVKAGAQEKTRLTRELEKENLDSRVQTLAQEMEGLRSRAGLWRAEVVRTGEERNRLEAEVRSAEAQEQRIQELRKKLEGHAGGLDQIRLRVEKSRKVASGKDLGRIQVEVKAVEDVIHARKADEDAAAGEMQSFQTRKQVLQESLEELETMGDRCPVCEGDIPEQRKTALVEARRKMISFLEGEFAKKKVTLMEKRKEREMIERSLDYKKTERERVTLAYSEIRDLQEKLEEILALKLRDEQALQGLEGQEKPDLPLLREQFVQASGKEHALRAELRALEERAADKESALADLQQRLELLTAYRKDAEKDERIARDLDGFSRALEITQESLRQAFLLTVNRVLEQVWQTLYPYGDVSSARLTVEEGDYLLQLHAGKWTDAESMSGGERSLACLALRIAFSLAFLPNLKWLILDEPTHNLDAAAIASFSEALRETLPGLAGQVFLITHDPALSEGLEHVHRLERDKDAGQATVARKV